MATDVTAVTTETEYDEPQRGKTRRVLVSPELAAMADIEGILDSLDDDPSRKRVLAWLGMRYGIRVDIYSEDVEGT